ncbi:low affinity immunoglobulin gamma Fc region receptor III-A-like [Gadus chalcogrammus]|uniref:low affinity immunoglobulin gamma Fc region receptor III-A-like n=1 Tax=Gadus chalcogrammus TaxID=1042646 RepID=UPI0024C4CA00|nr:low affinity immunoglobulin gamma Fc region receptor III-A-like [Gadus chalcogrammus]
MFWPTSILVLLHLTRGNSPCFGRSLGISPSRTQFFKRESLTLCCGADERIMTNSKSACSQKIHECNIKLAGVHHSGSYWCDSNSGERGEAVNITVTEGSVILESPVHPVPEGTSVTLRCKSSNQSVVTPINQSYTFSRDGRLIGVGLTGEMSFAAVNRSHEGLYTCTFSGVESPGSWLAVRGELCLVSTW